MAYLKGEGTEALPYVIHDLAAWEYFLQNHAGTGSSSDSAMNEYHAVLCADIDASDSVVQSPRFWHAKLDGYGHKISGFRGYSSSIVFSFSHGLIKRLNFHNPIRLGSGGIFICVKSGVYDFLGPRAVRLEDAEITGDMNGGWFVGAETTSVSPYYTRTILGVSNTSGMAHGSSATSNINGSYNLTSAQFHGAFDAYADPDPYNPAHYPALTALPDLWIVDGASPPRLKPQPVAHLIQGYAVKGNVSLSNIAAERTVVALAPGDFRYIAETHSAPDGSFFLPTGLYADHVFVMALEHYGRQLLANKSYVLGEIIHPQQPNGYRYTCTTAGNSGATLPEEPWPTESNLIVGAAVFTPSPVYAPAVHGPVKPVLVDLLTQEPV